MEPAPAPIGPGAGQDIPLILHASCVALGARAALITGASGRGKSALALQMMALGATLVSDDRTMLWRAGADVIADAPPALRGLIEARFVGILNAKPAGPTPVALWVDLDRIEQDRLPPQRLQTCLGIKIPLVHNVEMPHFAAALSQYLLAGRSA